MRVHRFVALVLTALALTMTSAHVLEMPQKLGYAPDLYAAVNGSLYRYFAIVGGIYTVASLLAVAWLAWRARKLPSAGWTLAAALALAASFASWLLIVNPVNQEAARVGAAVWTELRGRWEIGHLVGFILTLAGFAALAASIVVDVPRVPVHAEVSQVVQAPPDRLMQLFLDHAHWHELFPATIRAVRLVGTEGATTTLEVDHATAGKVPNAVTVTGAHEIELVEHKPRYDARFVNRFEPVADGTRYTVVADVMLRGGLRALDWLAPPIVRSQVRRFVLAPMRAAAEHGSR